jgi:hypothetical protein
MENVEKQALDGKNKRDTSTMMTTKTKTTIAVLKENKIMCVGTWMAAQASVCWIDQGKSEGRHNSLN